MPVTSTNRVGASVPSTALRPLVVAVLVLAGVTLVVGPASAQSDTVTTNGTNTTVGPSMVEDQPADPQADQLGWENGVWYNATLSVDQSDGLDEAELRALVARTMARVERVRGLEFERTVPVRAIDRSQQLEDASELANVTDSERLAVNEQYEALLLINESRDAVDSMRNFLGVGVGGYYDPATENITVVSVTENALHIRETTLAQELYHAQQDQQFRLSEEFDTVEERNAANSLVEGDANYVEYLYEKRCEHEWNGSCYLPQPPERDQSAQNLTVNPGMVQIFLQPYNSGIAFVREHHRSEGGRPSTNSTRTRRSAPNRPSTPTRIPRTNRPT